MYRPPANPMTGPAGTYRMTTLGCRVNHAEQREMEAVLEARGLQRAAEGEPAAIEVVHTCSVTVRAAAKSRQAIRRAARRRSQQGMTGEVDDQVQRTAMVIATGCFVGSHAQQADALACDGGPGAAIGHADPTGLPLLGRFAQQVDRALGRLHEPPPTQSTPVRSGVQPLPILALPRQMARHARAEIRIQDGCDAHCTFCIIPQLRPGLRSKLISDVVAEARRLVDLGHREIVLSGIFIGAYGHATALRRRQAIPGASHLADLLDAVSQIDGLSRVRISSMEPMDVTPELLDAMVANDGVVVPHLHLPLQSGSDAILRRMNRQYRRGDYLDMIERTLAALTVDGLPPAITTDIICGFPGESEADFEATLDVARRVGFLHMHVFPFSPRSGTAAARWTDQFVPPDITRTRVGTLIDLENDPGDGLAARFCRRLLGRRVRALIEQADPDRPGWWRGRCDHYAMVSIRGEARRHDVVEIQVDEALPHRLPGTLTGRILPSNHPLPVLSASTPHDPLETRR